MSKRDVEHQSLQNFPFFRKFRKHIQIPHNLKPVCNLQYGDTRVGGILNYELFVILGFETGIFRLYGGDLVETFYHSQNLGIEAFGFKINLRMLSCGFVKKN